MVGQDSNYIPNRATLTVRACVISDGTPGISLSLNSEVVGEWTDSKARLLSLTEDGAVKIHGADGKSLYLFSMPGEIVSTEQVSDTEVVIISDV